MTADQRRHGAAAVDVAQEHHRQIGRPFAIVGHWLRDIEHMMCGKGGHHGVTRSQVAAIIGVGERNITVWMREIRAGLDRK